MVSETANEGTPGGHPGPGEVTLVVGAPKEPEPKALRFPWGDTVGEAANVAATDFGYADGNPSFQTSSGAVLDRTLTLREAGVHDGEKVELVDAGGGV